MVRRVILSGCILACLLLIGVGVFNIVIHGNEPKYSIHQQAIPVVHPRVSPTMTPTHSSSSRPGFQTGVSFPGWSTNAYSSSDTAWKPGLQEIQQQTRAQWIGMVIDFYQPTRFTPYVTTNSSTPTPQAVMEGIRTAKQQGFKVFIEPLITVGDPQPWAGVISYTSTSDIQTWFDSYWSVLHPYAIAAQQAGADEMAIGTEYEALQSVPGEYWDALIMRVHSSFSGLLTYDANWTTLYSPLPNWMKNKNLSFIGVDTYFPLVDSPQRVDPKLLPSLWATKVKQFIDNSSKQLGKPLLISEIGYRDTSDAAYNPYQRDTTAPRDDAEQAALYDAVLQNIAADVQVIGVFFWAWSTPPFAPDGKFAAQVLHKWYSVL